MNESHTFGLFKDTTLINAWDTKWVWVCVESIENKNLEDTQSNAYSWVGWCGKGWVWWCRYPMAGCLVSTKNKAWC